MLVTKVTKSVDWLRDFPMVDRVYTRFLENLRWFSLQYLQYIKLYGKEWSAGQMKHKGDSGVHACWHKREPESLPLLIFLSFRTSLKVFICILVLVYVLSTHNQYQSLIIRLCLVLKNIIWNSAHADLGARSLCLCTLDTTQNYNTINIKNE